MRILFYLLVFTASTTVFAQDYDFGKVSKEELEEKFNPLDSSASATYLYKYRKSYFNYIQGDGFQLITDVHERIKIYKAEGFDYATKSIRLYRDNLTRERVSSLKAYTYNLIDNKMEDFKLKKDGVFDTELSDYFDETKFTMPNIKEGSVIEYKYSIISPFYYNVDEFVFQHDIPVKKLKAKFETPQYLNFKSNYKGYLLVKPVVETKNDKITFRNTTRTGSVQPTTSHETSNVEFVKNINIYEMENIPALKEEPYVNNINNYRSAVKYELSYTKFPDALMEYYSTTWEDVVKKIYENPNFGNELDKTGYFEDDIDAIINTVPDPLKQISLIFDFVKSKVKWNNHHSKYTDKGVKKAYKDQVGNVAEINLMLTSMLRYAGLNANPVIVSTRNNGIPIFPTREGYNYVISSVKMPSGIILLDATSKYGSPNILPFRVLNWEGRIITKDGNSNLVSLYPTTNSKNTVTLMAKLEEDGSIEGNYRIVKTDHNALSYRGEYNDANEDDFIEKLENEYGGLEISEFKVNNTTDLSNPVAESYKFVKENQADIIGDKMYFSPLFFLATKENPFKLEKREFPVDFGYPSESAYRIILNLPEGYKVESIPETTALALPDNLGAFKYNISNNGSIISLLISTEINQSIIPSLYYDTLKEYFQLLIEKENEQIVLTRI